MIGPVYPGSAKAVAPPATIGILGGGQLGRMSAMAAKAMGYRIMVLTPEEDSPCSQVADVALVAPYDDEVALKRLIQEAAVITYEFENVPAHVVARLEERVPAHPSSAILWACQHRVREKEALRRLGAPTAEFVPVRNLSQLAAGVRQVGFPCVLKTATGGYDGKGQWVLHGPGELEEAFAALGGPAAGAPPDDGESDPPFILEAFVPFQKEISVIVARNERGECVTFPVAENDHRRNILHRTVAPARIPPELAQEARRLGETIAAGLGLVGVMGIELFVADGKLLVNELAPRPHNSGHFTLDACVTSQFEQHVRAVCGLPLGSPRPVQCAVMLNLLGEHLPSLYAHLEEILSRPGVKLHLYGKREARVGRKMGHLTVLADSVEESVAGAEDLWTRFLERGQAPGA